MIFADIFREIFNGSQTLSLSYTPFFLFMIVFIAAISGCFYLGHIIWNKILNR